MASKQVDVVVKEYVKLLRKNNIRVEKAILFGSHVSGRSHKDSDIDVAIISQDLGQDRIEEMVVLKEIAEEVNYDLSPRPYSLEQYINAQRGQFLHDEVIKKGKVIDA